MNIDLSHPLFVIGGFPVAPWMVLAVLAVAISISWLATGQRRARLDERDREALRTKNEESEARMAEILKAQSEMQGRMASMAEIFGARQSELNQTIQQKIDSMTSRIGQSMTRPPEIDP